jgi:hypothetical protein
MLSIRIRRRGQKRMGIERSWERRWKKKGEAERKMEWEGKGERKGKEWKERGRQRI